MNVLITGGAGFIGSHLVDRLLEKGYSITIVDNLSLGSIDNIEHNLNNERCNFIECDASSIDNLNEVFNYNQFDMVFHLIANSDIRKSSIDPSIEFDNTFKTTYNILECMRRNDIRKFFFASTSAIYGDQKGVPIKEDDGPLLPISYYGGAKLACEAFISSYAYMNNIDTVILRFPNVIGDRLTHGVIYDFINKLRMCPDRLQILGDGMQSKPYMHVSDLVNAIVLLTQDMIGYKYYNIGVESTTTVRRIADIICSSMNLNDTIYEYTGGNCGWKGDVPKFNYDINKIKSIGWVSQYTSDEAVDRTVKEVLGL